MDPLERIDPKGDTTVALIWESQKRGYDNFFCEIHELGLENDTGFSLCRSFELSTDPNLPLEITWQGERTLKFFNDFDFVWMRKDPPVDQNFMTATMILEHHDPAKTWVLNNPRSLRVANEKLWAHFASQYYPKTIVSADAKVLLTAAAEMTKVVLKPIDAAGGFGIFVFSADDRNLRSAIEVLSQRGSQPIIMQEYLPALLVTSVILSAENKGQSSASREALITGPSPRRREKTGSLDERDLEVAAFLKPHLLDLGFICWYRYDWRPAHGSQRDQPNRNTWIRHLEKRSGNDLSKFIFGYLEANKFNVSLWYI